MRYIVIIITLLCAGCEGLPTKEQWEAENADTPTVVDDPGTTDPGTTDPGTTDPGPIFTFTQDTDDVQPGQTITWTATYRNETDVAKEARFMWWDAVGNAWATAEEATVDPGATAAMTHQWTNSMTALNPVEETRSIQLWLHVTDPPPANLAYVFDEQTELTYTIMPGLYVPKGNG